MYLNKLWIEIWRVAMVVVQMAMLSIFTDTMINRRACVVSPIAFVLIGSSVKRNCAKNVSKRTG